VLLEPNPANGCLGCGAANARGMHLTFEQDEKEKCIRGLFRLGEEYQGGPGLIHGGIIATLLDEAMGKVNRFRNVLAVTAELVVEYLKPIPVGEELLVEAREVEKHGRNLHHVGEVCNRQGQVLARGHARFVEIDAAKFAARWKGSAKK
jgi:uncharacterized protein (TIGR00369 family)